MICSLQGIYFPHPKEMYTLVLLIKQEKEMYKVLNDCKTFSHCKQQGVVSVSFFGCFPETVWHNYDLPQYLQYPS